MILSEKSLSNILKYIELFFLAFIVLQPFLDLVAYFGSQLSLLIRGLAMLIGIVYLLIHTDRKYKSIAIIYLILLGLFFLVNAANNYFIKDPYNMVRELTYGIKSYYVIEMLIVYTAVFLSIRKRMNWEMIIQRSIFINMIIIGVIMLLATISDTGMMSYSIQTKEGHSGWFYSANDLSAALGLGFGIMILFLMNIKNKISKLLILPCILLVAWSMLTIGTRVGLGSVIIILGIGIVISLISIFIKKNNWTNFVILISALFLSVAYLPYSAIGNNLGINPYIQNDNSSILENTVKDPDTKPVEHNNDDIDISQIHDNIVSGEVLNGRNVFTANAIEDWKNAPMSQKLLGMGPGGNYKDHIKLIEMDFLDWIFGYGIIGTMLLILPILYFIFSIIKNILKYKFKQVDHTLLILGVAITLGLGIAAFAGHVFINPASGIYFSILLSYLYILSIRPNFT